MKPVTVPIHAAKTHLSRLVERVLAGEEVTISRGSEPVVRLIAVTPPHPRVPGRWKAALGNCHDILDALADDELAAWEGE